MTASVRAELLRLGRWPVTWVLCGTWLALNLTFGYLFDYLSYRGEAGPAAAALLGPMLPDRVPVTMAQGLPMFGGALVLILGAVAVGSGYGWGTWKTVFAAGPRRITALSGTLGALGIVLAGLVLATFAVDLLASLGVAAAESQAVTLPSPGDAVRGVGVALLVTAMWLSAGVLLGTLARGPALAVGLGLVWALVVENLLRGVASMLGPVEAVTDVLPGTAAGSLVGALGGLAQGDPNGTPGVLTTLGGTTATALLCAYMIAFVAAALTVTARRDIAS